MLGNRLRGLLCAAARLLGGFGAAIGMLTGGCDRGNTPPDDGVMHAVVSIPPLAGIIQPLLPEGSRVTVLVAPGSSVHGHQFRPSDLRAIDSADVVLTAGLGLEPQLTGYLRTHARAGRVELTLAELAGVEGDTAHGDDAHDHSDHEGHHHGADPHVWLDPVLVRAAIAPMRDALIVARDADGPIIRARAEAFEGEVDALIGRCERGLGPLRGRSIITHHAAFGRLAERFGIEVAEVLRPVEGAEPSAGEVARAVRAIQERGVGVIFVEPQFDQTLARRIAEQSGVRVEVLDPLGDGDWLGMMQQNIDALARGIGGDGE